MCKVCGDERTAAYRPSKRQTLCDYCNADTPAKIGRNAFDLKYWGADFEQVHHATRREFYSDYLASSKSFADYLASTTDNVA